MTDTAGRLPSATPRTKAERQLVVAQEVAFNQNLTQICATYARCRWDGGAVYNYRFGAS